MHRFLIRWLYDLPGQGVWIYAGNLAFRIVFCLFPALLFILSAMVALGYAQQTSQLLTESKKFLPGEVINIAKNQLADLDKNPRPIFTISAVIATLILFWIISGVFGVLFRFCNTELLLTRDERPWYSRLRVAVGLAIVCLLGGIAAITLATAGPEVVSYLTHSLSDKVPWELIRWIIIPGCYLGIFYLITAYAPAPPKRTSQARLQVAGAIALVAWLAFSWVFRHYLLQFIQYNETYGTIAGAIIILLYFYYSAVIFLIGLSLHFRLQQKQEAKESLIQEIELNKPQKQIDLKEIDR